MVMSASFQLSPAEECNTVLPPEATFTVVMSSSIVALPSPPQSTVQTLAPLPSRRCAIVCIVPVASLLRARLELFGAAVEAVPSSGAGNGLRFAG